MYIAILFMVAGYLAGVLLRRRFTFRTGTVMLAAVCVLLFVLGMELGRNRMLMESLSTLGLKALAVAVLSVAGSVVCAAFLYRLIRKDNGKDIADNAEVQPDKNEKRI